MDYKIKKNLMQIFFNAYFATLLYTHISCKHILCNNEEIQTLCISLGARSYVVGNDSSCASCQHKQHKVRRNQHEQMCGQTRPFTHTHIHIDIYTVLCG